MEKNKIFIVLMIIVATLLLIGGKLALKPDEPSQNFPQTRNKNHQTKALAKMGPNANVDDPATNRILVSNNLLTDIEYPENERTGPLLYRFAVKRKSRTLDLSKLPYCTESAKQLECFLMKPFNMQAHSVEYISYNIKETAIQNDRGRKVLKDLFDAVYYVRLIHGTPQISTGTYEQDDFTLTVSAPPEQLLKYTEDRQYCEKDQDCELKLQECEYDAFNNFEKWNNAYGCEDEGEEDRRLLDETKCGENKKAVLTYSKPKCIKNKCTSSKKVGCEKLS